MKNKCPKYKNKKNLPKSALIKLSSNLIKSLGVLCRTPLCGSRNWAYDQIVGQDQFVFGLAEVNLIDIRAVQQ